MRVRFHMPRGARYDEHPDGLTFDLDMPGVPRVDETVTHDEITFRVHVVNWMPDEPEYVAYVVLR